MSTEQVIAPMLVIFPRGQLSELDKARMEAAGILAVEADDPKTVIEIKPSMKFTQSVIDGDALITSALDAMSMDRDVCKRFVTGLRTALTKTA